MQKRTARITAMLALTGCGVLISAASADAAGSPQPRQVSTTTCSGLAADLANTVAEAVKALSGSTPNLAQATSLIEDATKLSNAITSLGCSNVSLPSVPSVPSTGGVTGGSSPLGGATGALGGGTSPVSTVTGSLGGAASPVSSVTGALGGADSPLSSVTGALGGVTGAASGH